jgi:hypothetical protein
LSDAALSPRSKPFVETSNQKKKIELRRADIVRHDRSNAPRAQKSCRGGATTLFWVNKKG